MRQGGIMLASVAVLACTACVGGGGKLEIRSSASGLATGREPVPFRVAEARGHLTLGNVALALEGFRKAAREDPASIEALAGIAACYDQMGRFDLSRRHYEMALALAPANTGLLAAFAGSLDAQGLAAQAASVRREMAAIAVPATIPPQIPQAAPRMETSAMPAMTVAEPVAIAAEPVQPVNIAKSIPAPSATVPQVVGAPVGRSVTIALPPPRPVDSTVRPAARAPVMAVAPVGRSVTIALAPPRPAAAAAHRSPRLERLSLNEVALVTGNGPRWKRADAPAVRSAARTAPPRAYEVRLLNAARVDKLAARTRAYLGNFGWRKMAVGDAAAVRSHSLIVYPEGRRSAALRLSARLGFAMAERPGVRQVTVLLGRDAAALPGLRPKA